jgi:hypothetical protein
VHAPAWQVSPVVQALLSLHTTPSDLGGFEHAPVTVSHKPGTWHWSEAAHVTGSVPVHTPAWHVSVCVHALPSLQLVPFAFGGLEQMPVEVSHTPGS